MTESQRLFVNLIRNAVWEIDISDDLPREMPDWDELLGLAGSSAMLGIVFRALNSLPEELMPSREIMAVWKMESMRVGVRSALKGKNISEFFKKAYEKNLNVLLFKGNVLAALYPEPHMRSSSDTDIWIDFKDKDAAEEILSELGYMKNPQLSKENVPVWELDGFNRVELHTRLWEDYVNEQTEILDSFDLTSRDARDGICLSGVQIETMEPTKHLVYQIYHVVKHLAYKGINLRHFVDITLFINHYADNIDFKMFWEAMGKLGYKRFCSVFMQICVENFQLDPRAEKGMMEQSELSGIGLDMFWELAFSGNSDEMASVASSAVYQAYHGENEKGGSPFSVFVSLVFPKREALSFRYEYARKYPILLPVAWIHRIINSIFRVGGSSKVLLESTNMANNKLGFLKEIGLIKDK